jgi:hypothetical protein
MERTLEGDDLSAVRREPTSGVQVREKSQSESVRKRNRETSQYTEEPVSPQSPQRGHQQVSAPIAIN